MTKESLPDIRKSVTLNAPIDLVWQAVSTKEGIAEWWMPSTLEAKLGHEFVLHAGNFGESACKITELAPPYLLSFDWDQDWKLTIELQELDGGKTEFTLIHSGWDATKTTIFGQPHKKTREIMDGGWENIVKEKLPAYIHAIV